MNSKEIAKLELWIVTGCIILAFLFSLADSVLTNINHTTIINGISKSNITIIGENLVPILFNYLIIYICYLFLVFHVSPELNKKEGPAARSVAFVYLFITAAILISIVNIYWAVLLALKLLFILFTCNRANKENAFYIEAGFLTGTWILIISTLFLISVHPLVKLYTILVIPLAIILYLYAIYINIPKASKRVWKRTRYFFSVLGITILYMSVLAGIVIPLSIDNDSQFSSVFINSFITTISIKQLLAAQQEKVAIPIILGGNFLTQLIIITPLAWKIYKDRNAIKTEEIITLKTELGKADANLNFLKSQINPHFLFNALNTLYGTALQEKADRTGEGIQKLGDMMRFMLQENIEDKILLSKDVDYLNNYIALQKLRTSISPEIIIETQIEEQINNLLISPMLLIPFVENAFKHGISLQSPSHIKITLQTSGHTLYFDVHNSIHLKQDNDPEKLQSGIGLQNVKQRLALLYPDQHELIIRQNAKEFFVHLTLQLSGNA
ncbi:MAG: histidine kinase [Candidatus Pedobacter colombiensis]|uniref:Histidine kinase n=1 Tax=Candidatus Pedobacter colombiensis TaxID=3121371 RepID=A0AAJ6B955_9SPHI|nr:histidine kinase [Pedobacter sp.]WEK19833.1 MAG: histidine kinase [Pedobacter sp.]